MPIKSSASGVPAGTVAYFAANAVPAGWLKANGATVSRTAYAALFLAIGTTYGAGDGATTFVLPDCRGEFLRGLDDGRGVDEGRIIGSKQIGSITGGYPLGSSATFGLGTSSAATGKNTANGWDKANLSDFPEAYYGGASGTVGKATTQAVLDSYFGVTRPRNVAMLACIKF